MLSARTLLSAVSAIVLLTQQSAAVTTTQNDIDTLNYALTLEHLEATFYATGQSVFSAADFEQAGYSINQYQLLTEIAQQEAAHVAALTSTIQSLGGTPVEACQKYTYGVNSVQSYLLTAHTLESAGVSAYVCTKQLLHNTGYK